jgi:hypothetical protein
LKIFKYIFFFISKKLENKIQDGVVAKISNRFFLSHNPQRYSGFMSNWLRSFCNSLDFLFFTSQESQDKDEKKNWKNIPFKKNFNTKYIEKFLIFFSRKTT